MSCWMTGNKELAILAKYVAKTINDNNTSGTVEGLRTYCTGPAFSTAFNDCYDTDGVQNPLKVFDALYRLNEAAFDSRYGEKPDDDGVPAMPEVQIDTREETRKEWQVRLLWLLRFYLYQTMEDGTVLDQKRMALKGFADTIAQRIGYEAAQAMDLKWGEF